METSKERSMDRSRRLATIWIALVTLLLFCGTVAVLAIGGRPDPVALRAAAPPIDGAWRFHVGDDPRWSTAVVDDSDWETIDLSAPASSIDGDVGLPNYVDGWMARGHPGYQGYAWYRRKLTIPAGNRAWDILGPTAVEDGYELYWNGQLLGGSGRIDAPARVVGTRPMIFPLPSAAAGTHGVLAIRAFMQPGSDAAANSGGVHVAPTLAPRPESRSLYRVQWWRTFAGYIVELVEPVAMFALVILALAMRPRSTHPRFIAVMCIALMLSALKRLDNAIVSWTDLMSLPTYVELNNVVWMPLSLAAWTLAWNRWTYRPSRWLDAATLVLTMVGMCGGALRIATMTHIFRLGLLTLFVFVAVRIVRQGPARVMAVATLAMIVLSQYTGELGSIGVPTIWFPFGIGVTLTQYVYAVAIPLLAVLTVGAWRGRGTDKSIGEPPYSFNDARRATNHCAAGPSTASRRWATHSRSVRSAFQ